MLFECTIPVDVQHIKLEKHKLNSAFICCGFCGKCEDFKSVLQA